VTSSSCGYFFVDWICFRLLFNCPIAVVSPGGGYRLRLASVSPANGGRNPHIIACGEVDVVGENKAA
jgi:hypothetical protein